jgi:hypothetical protein
MLCSSPVRERAPVSLAAFCASSVDFDGPINHPHKQQARKEADSACREARRSASGVARNAPHALPPHAPVSKKNETLKMSM